MVGFLARKFGNGLVDLAKQCRADFENGVVSDEMLISMYQKYMPEQASFELEDRLREWRWYFPDENCEFASVYLRHKVGQGTIREGGYQLYGNRLVPHNVLHLGWTTLATETIVDITADQFDGPAVYVGALQAPWRPPTVHAFPEEYN